MPLGRVEQQAVRDLEAEIAALRLEIGQGPRENSGEVARLRAAIAELEERNNALSEPVREEEAERLSAQIERLERELERATAGGGGGAGGEAADVLALREQLQAMERERDMFR